MCRKFSSARVRPGPTAVACVATLLALPSFALGQSTIPERLSLQDAVKLALERNPVMVEARAGVDAAAADRATASRRPNPAMSIDSEGYPLFEADRPSFSGNQELTVRLAQELELGGRRRLRTQIAEGGQRVAGLDLKERARQVELEVKRAYVALVLAQTDKAAAQTAQQDIDRIIDLNRARFAQGEISGTELRRVQVERLRFVEDVFAADLAVRNASSALLALLDAPALGQSVVPTDSLAAPQEEIARLVGAGAPGPTPIDPSAMISRALSGRPDVLSAREAGAVAETSTRLQRALRTPNVTIGGGYRNSFGTKGVVFGATIPLPLFNRNQGGVARAQAEQRAAVARSTAAQIAARLDIQRGVNAVQTNRARVDYIEREYLTSARESRDIVLESYRLGVASLIDFLDAQRAFRDTQRTYNRALFDQRVSLFELGAAVGQSEAQP